jgi:hypothetical protein
MARIRTIKPEFFKHEGLYDAERETGLPLRVAFAGIWTQCDREGRFAWRPRQLKTDVLPYDDVDFSRVLDALTTRGFIVRYASPEGDFGCVPSWSRHQVLNNREKASDIPPPTTQAIEAAAKPDACATREPRVPDATLQLPSGREGERKGKEGEREGSSNAPSAPTTAEGREVAWEGRVIRLTRRDYDRWRLAYPNADIDAELQAADDYYATNRPKDGNWFFAVSSWLKRANGSPRLSVVNGGDKPDPRGEYGRDWF